MKNILKIIYVILINAFIVFSLCSCQNAKINDLRKKGIEALDNGNYEEAHDLLYEALMAGKGQVGRIQYDIGRF